ncbi:MOSC domain-containing protein [Shewanella maritima]|uniref:MOSC domain-containing protein n=1 Tax=Shewanella maritima TaxID=2520507 RepID=UPI0037352412
MSITLTGIAFKKAKLGQMLPVDSADVTVEKGVNNDIFGRPGKRQVTLLSAQQWQQACNELQQPLDWLTRRANLLIEGYIFSANDVGKSIRIGNDCILEITGETDPCGKMEQAVKGLEAALSPDWRGGVTARVIKSGKITLTDQVSLNE